MAGGKIKGITVEIGGDTTKLGKALADVNKNTRDLQSELKGVESLLKMDPGNVDLLAQRQEILTEAVEETTQKLKILKEAEEQVVKQFENGDIGADQFRDFQREIIATQNKLDGFEAALNGTESEIEDVGEAAEESSDGFTIMGGALADLVSNAIQGAISAIKDLIGALFDLSEATEEYRTMQAKLAGSADTFGYSVEFASSKYKEFYNYLGDDQMATNAITNLMGLGTSTENVSSLAQAAISVWSAYGDSIPIEALTESMNETAQVGKVTGNLADALNWAGYSEDRFNESLAKCHSTQQRATLIAQVLNATYGDSKTRFDSLNASIIEANAAELELKQTQAQLGETMQPVNTAIMQLKNQALEAIIPLVEILANAFLNLLNWLKEHPVVMKILTAVVIALALAFGVLATALGIQALINGVTKAFGLLNLTMLANPIVLIVALIAALVAAFVYLLSSCEGFQEFWIELWDTVETALKTAWDSIKSFFTKTVPEIVNSVANKFKELPGKIYKAIEPTISKVTTWGNNVKSKAVSAITSMVSSVTAKAQEIPGKIGSAIQGAISRVQSWGSGLASAAASAMYSMVNNIVSIASSLPSRFVAIGQNIIQGIANGINSMVGHLYNSITNALSGLVNRAKQALGINSPSKVFAETVGVAVPEGIAKGINDNVDIAENAVVNMTDDLSDQAAEFNGATINRKLAATFTANAGTIDNNSALLSKLDGIYERLNRLQIVLDSGTLVGETIDRIDAALASKQILSARGV